jgi:uncharacterized protein (DUF1778 family)
MKSTALKASRQAAENALMDQTFFQVDARTHAQFLTVLDRPPAYAGYKRLMRAPKPWAKRSSTNARGSGCAPA